MPPTAPFSPALFAFLAELAENNHRDFFHAQKARYEADVRGPCLRFIADFSGPLERISPHFVADARKVGGSLFRIHRDTRFSKDKKPYKTASGIQFRHEAGRDAHAPGFYLHLEPGDVFIGAGMWHPDGDATRAVRTAIADHAEDWQAVLDDDGMAGRWRLVGDSLARAPAGFDAAHRHITDLKRKDFIAVLQLDEEAACAADFGERFAAECAAAAPLMAFLCRAVGVAW